MTHDSTKVVTDVLHDTFMFTPDSYCTKFENAVASGTAKKCPDEIGARMLVNSEGDIVGMGTCCYFENYIDEYIYDGCFGKH